MLAVFCIRRTGEPPPSRDLRGPGGHPIRLLEEGPLGIWYAEDSAPAQQLDAVRGHDAVVRDALRSATPVPIRYGAAFGSEEEVRASLRERRDELLAALDRVAGRVEMGIRVEWEVDESERAADHPITSGREYLLDRRRELSTRAELRSRAAALLDEVESRVAPEECPSVRKLLPEAGVAGLLAHLVQRREVRAYRSRLEAARQDVPHAVLRLSGPWAPYSFV